MRPKFTVLMLFMLTAACTATGWAYPGGITGVTRKTGGSGCAGCHSGSSVNGLVTISGPTTLKVGQTGTYTLTISSGTLIGCDIAVSSGTPAEVSSNLKLDQGEITHSRKLSGTSVQFTWTPSATGAATIYATGAKNSKSGGWGHASDFSVTVEPAGTTAIEPQAKPTTFSLDQNYPNPFNPSTTIRFSLPAAAHVSLTVVNLLGEEVATLVARGMEAGTHLVQWDASGIPSGIYFYRLEAKPGVDGQGAFIETRRLVLLK